MMSDQPSDMNYDTFRECLSNALVARSEPQRKKGKRIEVERIDPEELAEFFLASEAFTTFPEPLQTLSYAALQHNPSLAIYVPEPDTPLPRQTLETICSPVPVSVTDSLVVYGIIPDAADLVDFLSPVLTEYTTSVTTGPPVWANTRADACEICERDWIPLSYHHLIPRGVHAKVLKRGWHDEWTLNSVAWLCRACHSFVHRMASNEELAREWYTVEKICEREDVMDWAKWVGRVRWKAK
ncbi:unnamed protein product [Penicillium olsonii]|uniref:Uncharacterized protein n=1 Tax=Penicillium olsonii TaxID=99116 RepID=A0A9W4HW44_PENOL|nr:unnamed protein product [Penicillium olsonii]CAG7932295.1 unnamed protein product [Penicillium olsonii]CAG8134776.1 unnamed protein product [Penicillium olsonii]CAG8137399.1 unnamed protein product [Penicillium olsonii]CAG8139741.1 unnamed protein product [Penicillium olsonii]